MSATRSTPPNTTRSPIQVQDTTRRRPANRDNAGAGRVLRIPLARRTASGKYNGALATAQMNRSRKTSTLGFVGRAKGDEYGVSREKRTRPAARPTPLLADPAL